MIEPRPPVPLVLASGSRYRAGLLAAAGVAATIDPADIDERALDDLLGGLGAEGLALELARRKAAEVAGRHPGCWVLAADQVGVLGEGPSARMLTKQPSEDGAVAQLLAMAGTTHRLVNGVVVLDVDSGRRVAGVDVQVVTMADYGEAEARHYVVRFEPWDTAGSYRLEDQIEGGGGDGSGPALVAGVEGEDPSGVVGLPLPLVGRLFAELAAAPVAADRGPGPRSV